MRLAKDQFRSTVVARADVRNIRLALFEPLGGAEIADFQDMAAGVDEDVLRLDIPVANANRFEINESSEHFVSIQLHQHWRNHLLHLEIVLHNFVNGIRNVIHDYVEVHFTIAVSVGVEGLPHFDIVGLVELFEDLEFSVFVPRVLEDLLDGDWLSSFSHASLEHNPEGAVADDLLRIVCQLHTISNEKQRRCV